MTRSFFEDIFQTDDLLSMNRKETEKGYFIEKLYSLFPEWLFGKIRDVSGENDLAKVLPRASAG